MTEILVSAGDFIIRITGSQRGSLQHEHPTPGLRLHPADHCRQRRPCLASYILRVPSGLWICYRHPVRGPVAASLLIRGFCADCRACPLRPMGPSPHPGPWAGTRTCSARGMQACRHWVRTTRCCFSDCMCPYDRHSPLSHTVCNICTRSFRSSAAGIQFMLHMAILVLHAQFQCTIPEILELPGCGVGRGQVCS